MIVWIIVSISRPSNQPLPYPGMVHCTLHQNPLNCIAVHYTVCPNPLHCTPKCTAVQCNVRPIALQCSALYAPMHCSALHCTPQCTAMHCSPARDLLRGRKRQQLSDPRHLCCRAGGLNTCTDRWCILVYPGVL